MLTSYKIGVDVCRAIEQRIIKLREAEIYKTVNTTLDFKYAKPLKNGEIT